MADSITDIFDAMNTQIRDVFSPGVCTFIPGDGSPEFTLKAIPLDPIRSEGALPSNFILRVAFRADFLTAGYLPVNGGGDKLTVEDGTRYMVEQVQADSGGEVRMILKKASAQR